MTWKSFHIEFSSSLLVLLSPGLSPAASHQAVSPWVPVIHSADGSLSLISQLPLENCFPTGTVVPG